jgi:hypothetical protein
VLSDKAYYPDPDARGKKTCCFFCHESEKVLFCCTGATDLADKPAGKGFMVHQIRLWGCLEASW